MGHHPSHARHLTLILRSPTGKSVTCAAIYPTGSLILRHCARWRKFPRRRALVRRMKCNRDHPGAAVAWTARFARFRSGSPVAPYFIAEVWAKRHSSVRLYGLLQSSSEPNRRQDASLRVEIDKRCWDEVIFTESNPWHDSCPHWVKRLA